MIDMYKKFIKKDTMSTSLKYYQQRFKVLFEKLPFSAREARVSWGVQVHQDS
jgi:hypothetical protein